MDIRSWPMISGLAALCVLAAGCSKSKAPEAKAPDAASQKTAAQPAAETAMQSMDEQLPPILCTPWKGDLDEIAKRRVVRVLVPFRRPEFFYMDGKPVGILQETFQELERVLNAKYKTTASNRIIVTLLPTAIDKLRDRMLGGFGDIAAYSLSITEENRRLVDFTIPTVTGQKVIIVTGPGAPELSSLEDLSGKNVWIRAETRFEADLKTLNARLSAQGKAPVVMKQIDPVLEPGDVMEMVNAGTYPIALAQSTTAEFWAQVFDKTKPRMDLALAEDVDLGWAIQKGSPQWKAFLDDFISTRAVGTSFGNTLLRRYLKDAKYVKNAGDAAEMRKFGATAPFFKKYASDYQLDYLLLAAQGYQESGLDQTVKSHVGAVGIMQVMPSTAAAEPVKIRNIQNEENNIHAGVRLIHFLIHDYFDEPGLDPFNRELFAIASYNAGPAKIAKCRKAAENMGYDPNKWFGNVEVAVAKVVGRETTQYVSNVYKYYISYRMAAEIRDRKTARKPN